MRDIDRSTAERCGLPSLLLMEAAANAAARTVASIFPQTPSGLRVLVLCGRGNNGGDGAALARILFTRGSSVEAVLLGRVDDTQGDAQVNFDTLRNLSRSDGLGGLTESNAPSPSAVEVLAGDLSFVECNSIEEWETYLDHTKEHNFDVVIDALFGTGLTRPLEGLHLEAVNFLHRVREQRAPRGDSKPLLVSLDLPSGLNADSAELIGDAVRADLTVTFTAPKPANVLPPASHFNGQLFVADIGSPAALLDESPSQLFLVEADDARAWLRQTRYAPDSFKNTHGHALVVAGSRALTGAAVLCAEAAMRSGAGLVTVATPASAVSAVAARVMPEVMTATLPETEAGAANAEAFARVAQLSDRADVIAIGSGLTSDDEETRRFVRAVVERRELPVVIDADGLNSLAPWSVDLRGSAELPLILTPHVGEMRRLIGVDDKDALKDRVRVAREFATGHALILVLKGARTITAAPDGRVFVNPTGNAGLGTAGAGDTLTGIIAGFIAQARGALKDQADVLASVLAAVYVGGLAGDIAARERGMRTMVASDIREQLGAAVRALDPVGEQPC
ncbi:MAG: ADP-dependent NAD(P)H-hydrate dehydratase / NAD(P)H-hydrate epimerase [Acidobacteriota bacterium]|nr:ADP-dependent NAD(P)H-hydrate dehydratase / NAD(P)H-hydrate epimerase [Acidobacteriota bacterium]